MKTNVNESIIDRLRPALIATNASTGKFSLALLDNSYLFISVANLILH